MRLLYRDSDLKYKISLNIIRRISSRYKYNKLLNSNLRYYSLIYYFFII